MILLYFFIFIICLKSNIYYKDISRIRLGDKVLQYGDWGPKVQILVSAFSLI